MKKHIKLIQLILQSRGWYNGEIDGIVGRKTRAAVARIAGLNLEFSEKRVYTAAIQLLAKEAGIASGPIDGYLGPVTQHAFESLSRLVESGALPPLWRPEELIVVNPNNWPRQYTTDFDSFYGTMGSALVRVEVPYTLRIAWDTSKKVNSFMCHEKVKDSIVRVLSAVLEHYGEEEIKRLRLDLWGGCYNQRPIRGGTRWSMHSWGVALDFDPSRNQLSWGRDKASLAKPEYEHWWKCWEKEGWTSLGRSRNFDWMHVQAAGI